jgi:hypothetical protein
MNEIQGTYRDGHVELTAPVNWPDGTPVTVEPKLPTGQAQPTEEWRDTWGIDDDWPDTPENRAEILRRMDAVEPLDMTPEEEAEWHAMLDWFGEYTRDAVKRDMGLTS